MESQGTGNICPFSIMEAGVGGQATVSSRGTPKVGGPCAVVSRTSSGWFDHSESGGQLSTFLLGSGETAI